MNPMLDPDLIAYVDDETLLAAFATVQSLPDQDERAAILEEVERRNIPRAMAQGSAPAPQLRA